MRLVDTKDEDITNQVKVDAYGTGPLSSDIDGSGLTDHQNKDPINNSLPL